MKDYLVMYYPPRTEFAEHITPDEQTIVDRHVQYLAELETARVTCSRACKNE